MHLATGLHIVPDSGPTEMCGRPMMKVQRTNGCLGADAGAGTPGTQQAGYQTPHGRPRMVLSCVAREL